MNTVAQRIDVFLSENGYARSRTLAQKLIEEGVVFINGKLCIKPSDKVAENDSISVSNEKSDSLKFVGRGGLKLEGALFHFEISLNGLNCLDIGASTGGFTDCMLQNGAKTVVAVDVGTNQLDNKLRNDERVISYEKTDIRNADMLSDASFDFIGTDVSFISLKKVLPSMKRLLSSKGICVALIKPQFEAGKKNLSKNGIVHDKKIQEKIISDISDYAVGCGFDVVGVIDSPITGGDGNKEYLICLRNQL